MNKMELLLHGWDTCYGEEDWYPPLAKALNGLTAGQASWKPQREAANSIWETVNHLTFYKERLLKRLQGAEKQYPSSFTNDDTFTAAGASGGESAWQEAVERLRAVHQGIRDAIAGMTDDEFDRPLPQNKIGFQLFSLITHDAYHTGQIVQIRKLQGSWPAKTSY